jgi:crotonyl-CoA carboxylase/reductase
VAIKETVDMETIAYQARGKIVDEPITFGVVPGLDVLPKTMRAWVIRRKRPGEPMKSFKEKIILIPEIGPNEVLILVMAAGVNYLFLCTSGKQRSDLKSLSSPSLER